MGKLKILDCTLRDGGYINNWRFGEAAIKDICEQNTAAGADILEVGFLRDIKEDKDTAVFSSMDSLQGFIGEKNPAIQYALMAEMANPFPHEKISARSSHSFDILRYTFWKRCLNEGWEYCRMIKNKGYDLCVQPTRVEQYNIADFQDMIIRFGSLEPCAIYIVDTFGLLTKDMLKWYADIADRFLPEKVALGYHAHNNMQQAFSNAVAFQELNLDRDIIIDVSAFGMGRGAGNLNSEIFLNYLNENCGGQYNIMPIYAVWDKWLKDIYDKNKWGYTLYYLISAYYKGNPEWASYFMRNKFSVVDADRIMKSIPYEERIIFSEEKARMYSEVKG